MALLRPLEVDRASRARAARGWWLPLFMLLGSSVAAENACAASSAAGRPSAYDPSEVEEEEAQAMLQAIWRLPVRSAQTSPQRQNKPHVHPVRSAKTSPWLGGWCMCAHVPETWPAGVGNVILPGGFEKDASVLPVARNYGTYSNTCLTIGGDGVGDKGNKADCIDAQFIVNSASSLSVGGINFDMEGCLAGITYGQIVKLRKQIKALSPDLIVIYSPILSWATSDKNSYPDYNADDDIFISPMMYAGAESYHPTDPHDSSKGGWTQGVISGRLKFLSSWPKEKVYLTFSSAAAAACMDANGANTCTSTWSGDGPLAWLASTVKNSGYAGLFGWPSGDASTDEKTLTYAARKMT